MADPNPWSRHLRLFMRWLLAFNHLAGVAGDAAVGEEIGWVGENQVHAGFGNFCQDFQAVALEDFDVMFGVVENGRGQMRIGAWSDWGGSKLYGFAHFLRIRPENSNRPDR